MIESIKRKVDWTNYSPQTNSYHWEITIALQPEIFCYSNLKYFHTGSYKANFYKCGDDLVPLHYLAWSKITSLNRDFHQPQYFGILYLA
ncbi:MAG: hypothetical protein EOP43_05185 [Sphingobacteriaceae bacterium]|nr:MAG: hypothetical protein EOP43_05185 [Sphingobacteriaceae bacterium]